MCVNIAPRTGKFDGVSNCSNRGNTLPKPLASRINPASTRYLTVEIFHDHARALAAEVDGDDFVAITHLGALTLGFERQQMIEAGTLRLGTSCSNPTEYLLAEIKLSVLFTAPKRRAVS